MNLWKARFLQTGALLMQGGAGFLMVISGVESTPIPFMIGAVLGGTGLVLWGKGAQARIEPAAPTAPASPAVPAARAEPDVRRMEQMLEELQGDVASLREDRDFFRQLYAAQRAERQQMAGLTAEPMR